MEPSAKLSYTETRKGIDTAKTLFENDYDDGYVFEALAQKGYSKKQVIWFMRAAEVENVEQRTKSSRIIAIALGIAWAAIIILYFAWGKPTTVDSIGRQSELNPLYVLGGFLIFVATLFNYISSWRQLKRIRTKFPATPEEIGDHEGING